MKTLTSAFNTAKNLTEATPVWLLEVSDGSTTWYYSDQTVTVDGQLYTAQVLSWGTMSAETPRLTGGGVVSGTTIKLAEDSTTLASKIKIGSSCIVRLWFDNESLTDTEIILKGIISDPIRVSQTSIDFLVASYGSDKTAVIGDLIDDTAYPSARKETLGEVAPIVYGQVFSHRALPVNAGILTRLATALTTSSTTIVLADGSQLPSSGSVIIDLETIAYSARSGNTLSGLTPTNPVDAHKRGAEVLTDETNYDLLIADHAVTSIGTVYADGTPISGGSLVTVSGKSYLRFSDFPHDVTPHYVNNPAATFFDANDSSVYGDQLTFGDSLTFIEEVSNVGNVWSLGGLTTLSDCYEIADGTVNAVSYFYETDEYDTSVNSTWTGTFQITEDWASDGAVLDFGYKVLDADGVTELVAYTFLETHTFPEGSSHTINLNVTVNSGAEFVFIATGAFEWNGDFCLSYGELTQAYSAEEPAGTRVYVESTSAGIASQFDVSSVPNTSSSTGYAKKITLDMVGFDLDNPADITEHLLLNYANGVVSGDLHTSISANTTFGTDYDLGFAITDQLALNILLRQVAYQSASVFFWSLDGVAHLYKLPTSGDSSLKSLGVADYLQDSFAYEYSPYSDIVNSISANFDYQGGVSQQIVKGVNASSITEYGTLDGSSQFRLTLVNSSTAATNVVSDYLTLLANPKMLVIFGTSLASTELQLGDIIDITSTIGEGFTNEKLIITQIVNKVSGELTFATETI